MFLDVNELRLLPQKLLLQNKFENTDNNIYFKVNGNWQADHIYQVQHPELTDTSDCTINTSTLPIKYSVLSEKRRTAIPHPYLPERQSWLNLYYASWGFLEEKITSGKTALGFVEQYIDEGFNENIYQWDSAFMVAYATYASTNFPVMATLDNFYNKQEEDGYICRTYNETTGDATGKNDINPPLFAWMEARYVKITGNTKRLQRVLPVLDKYYDWINKNVPSKGTDGALYNTDFGSGMDNSPREDFIKKGAWIDLTAQQALAAKSLIYLAKQINHREFERKYTAEHKRLANVINEKMWSEKFGIYLDKDEKGNFHHRYTIASFWPMLADVADNYKAKRLINEHLKNPAEFFTPHLFPSLSKSDEVYDPFGHYWRGGVWAPTNFAVIKGIAKFDLQFAFEAAQNHIKNMSMVYEDFIPQNFNKRMPTIHEKNIQRNGDGIKQIWETYSPEYSAPATRWDSKLLVRQNFCGWSGVGPIALLIENVLGIEVRGDLNTIRWNPMLDENQGIDNLQLGTGKVDLRLIKDNENWILKINSTSVFVLEINMPHGKAHTLDIVQGQSSVILH